MDYSEAVNMLVSGATLEISRKDIPGMMAEMVAYPERYIMAERALKILGAAKRTMDSVPAIVSMNYNRESLSESFEAEGWSKENAALHATALFGNLVCAKGDAKAR